MDTSLVVDAVVQLISDTYTPMGIKVGDGQVPDLSKLTANELVNPHLIVYQIPIGAAYEGEGYGGGQGMEWVRLQFTTVGLTAQQVRGLAADAQSTLIARNPADTSLWISTIAVAEHAVIERRGAGTIPTEPSGLGFHGGRLSDLLVQFTG